MRHQVLEAKVESLQVIGRRGTLRVTIEADDLAEPVSRLVLQRLIGGLSQFNAQFDPGVKLSGFRTLPARSPAPTATVGTA